MKIKNKKSARPLGSALIRVHPCASVVCCLCLLFLCRPARAQQYAPDVSTNNRPAVLNLVGIDQKIGQQLSPDLAFRDETGRAVRLGDYFGNRPIILVLVYYQCPGLCSITLNELALTMAAMPTSVGRDFDVLTVSFDPRETPDLAAAKKKLYLREYARAGADTGWHFLTGNEDSIRALTDDVGFRYTWDAASRQYAHASGIIVISPQGKVARYFYGIDYSPRDLRLSLAESSSQTQTVAVADQVLLYCFHYDPTTGKYGLVVMRLVQIGAVATILLLGGGILLARRRDRATPERS
jgi:protein SCO1